MSSSFWLLAVESHDLSHAEKEIMLCKAELIHKMTTSFTQILVCCLDWICSALQAAISYLAWDKACDTIANSETLEDKNESVYQILLEIQLSGTNLFTLTTNTL